jgi:hypothetical protein
LRIRSEINRAARWVDRFSRCAMIPIRNARRSTSAKPMAVRMPVDEIKRRRLARSVRVRMETIKLANAR